MDVCYAKQTRLWSICTAVGISEALGICDVDQDRMSGWTSQKQLLWILLGSYLPRLKAEGNIQILMGGVSGQAPSGFRKFETIVTAWLGAAPRIHSTGRTLRDPNTYLL